MYEAVQVVLNPEGAEVDFDPSALYGQHHRRDQLQEAFPSEDGSSVHLVSRQINV